MNFFLDLPVEIIDLILQKLSQKDIRNLEQTCHSFYSKIQKSSIKGILVKIKSQEIYNSVKEYEKALSINCFRFRVYKGISYEYFSGILQFKVLILDDFTEFILEYIFEFSSKLTWFIYRFTDIDPTLFDNYAIKCAAEFGHEKVVSVLLRNAKVDPSVDDNYPFRIAAEKGYLNIVEMLLNDKRVDPCADDNYAIQLAAEEGHSQVVARLLQDSRIDPFADENYAIKMALENGHLSVVYMLLEDQRIDPNVRLYYSRKMIQLQSKNSNHVTYNLPVTPIKRNQVTSITPSPVKRLCLTFEGKTTAVIITPKENICKACLSYDLYQDWIFCDKCHFWFHRVCVGEFGDPEMYFCATCSN
jgi:hypothetical protein